MPVSTYSLVLFVHILAAIVLVGSTLFSSVVRRTVLVAGSAAEVRAWLGFGRRAAAANPFAALALLGSGIYLGRVGFWTQGFFVVAAGAWLVNSLLAALVVKRTAAAIAIGASRSLDGTVPPDVERRRRSLAWETAERVMQANDLAVLYLMVEKPALPASLALLLAANLVAFGVGLVRRPRPATATVAAAQSSAIRA